MLCSAICNQPSENCQLYLLINATAAVGMTLFIIGLVGHYQVGALAGVNAMTTISLITVGSSLIGIELALSVLFSIKKNRPLSYAEFQQLSPHINNGEWVKYYSLNNPNAIEYAHRKLDGTLHIIGTNSYKPPDCHFLSLWDLKKRNGEKPSCSLSGFLFGDC